MKDEFRTRISSQRKFVNLINNNTNSDNEELFGLSSQAIDRWVKMNSIEDSELVNQLYAVAEKLFLLANKSQEQVTSDYKTIVSDIKGKYLKLENHLS